MPSDRTKPYSDFPFHPSAGVDLATKAVFQSAIGACCALSELKGVGGAIPDPLIMPRSIFDTLFILSRLHAGEFTERLPLIFWERTPSHG